MWKVPRIWEDGEVWIIGGGPSIPYLFDVPENIIEIVTKRKGSPSKFSPYMSKLHGKHTIGINMAYTLGSWIDMVVFGDRGFYLSNRVALSKFTGIKVSVNPGHKGGQFAKEGIKHLSRGGKRYGISDHPDTVCWNGNTGAAAISVAVHAGAKRIVLLGFDMKLNGDRQHWHSLYGSAQRPMDTKRMMSLPFNRHLICFPDIAKDAKRLGVEIINACPDSAIKEFKKVHPKELL